MAARRPLSVLMIADAAGGVWTYAAALARAGAAQGLRYTLAAIGPRPTTGQLELLPRDVRVHHFDARLEWMSDPWEQVDRSMAWLEHLAAAIAPDVVHANGYAYACGQYGRPVVTVAHSCVCSWWRAVHRAPAPAEWDRYRERVAQGLTASAAVVAPSAAMRDALEREHGPVRRRSRVIRNGLDDDGTRGGKAPIVFAAGRVWDQAKNLAALDDIADAVDWPIVIAGRADDPSGTIRPPRRADWFGHLEPCDVAELMISASIYASPALYEPFGLSVLEAARAECALVLSDIPSMRELWSGAAWFVDPRDRASLREAIRGLIQQPTRRAELARAARARSMRYSAAAMALAYRELYEDLLGTGAVPQAVAAPLAEHAARY